MHQPMASGSLTLKEVEQTLKIIPAGVGSYPSFPHLNLARAADELSVERKKVYGNQCRS